MTQLFRLRFAVLIQYKFRLEAHKPKLFFRNILDILNRFHIDINCVESIMRVIAQINEIIKKEDDEEKKEDDEKKKVGEGDDTEEIENKNTNILISESVYVDISTQTDGTRSEEHTSELQSRP